MLGDNDRVLTRALRFGVQVGQDGLGEERGRGRNFEISTKREFEDVCPSGMLAISRSFGAKDQGGNARGRTVAADHRGAIGERAEDLDLFCCSNHMDKVLSTGQRSGQVTVRCLTGRGLVEAAELGRQGRGMPLLHFSPLKASPSQAGRATPLKLLSHYPIFFLRQPLYFSC
jgi:hypothetical protein